MSVPSAYYPSDTSPENQAWGKLVEQLEKQSKCGLIMLQRPFLFEVPEVVNKEFLLSTRHLFLPKAATEMAWKIHSEVNRLRREWEYGGTSLGNAIWDQFMIPNLAKAEKYISEKKWRKAVGTMFGIQMAAGYDDSWIHDQEIYCEFDIFSGWFSDYSAAWRTLLSKTDKELGFNCNVKPGGYREFIEDLIRTWEKETNQTLQRFDEFAEEEDTDLARVHIFTEPEEGDDDEEEDEDEMEQDSDEDKEN